MADEEEDISKLSGFHVRFFDEICYITALVGRLYAFQMHQQNLNESKKTKPKCITVFLKPF
jgi:hypothetical protein